MNTPNYPDLIYRLATNEDYYTHDSDGEYLVPQLLDNYEAKVAEYLKEQFPGLDFDIERVPETFSRNNRSKTYTEQGEQALAALDNYVEDNWYNWWPEVSE